MVVPADAARGILDRAHWLFPPQSHGMVRVSIAAARAAVRREDFTEAVSLYSAAAETQLVRLACTADLSSAQALQQIPTLHTASLFHSAAKCARMVGDPRRVILLCQRALAMLKRVRASAAAVQPCEDLLREAHLVEQGQGSWNH